MIRNVVMFRGWQSYDAVDWAPVCPQPIKYVGATKNSPLMDEDCLYLNVFTPTHESKVGFMIQDTGYKIQDT